MIFPDDLKGLFEQIYWAAIAFHFIALVMGFWVITAHQKLFARSNITKIFNCPTELIYLITVLSTLGNMVVIWALIHYNIENYVGYMPTARELAFSFYHALEGVTVIGWHGISYLILKQNSQGAR